MVVFDAGSGSRPGAFANAVRVIEAEQPLAIFVVKRERIIQPMRSFRRNGNLLYNELDPTLSVCVCDEALAVEQQERIETRIAYCHYLMLLLGDNLVKAGLWRSEENAGILRSAQNDKRKGTRLKKNGGLRGVRRLG
jgi:hypothetical protein